MIYDIFPIETLHNSEEDFNEERIKYPSEVKISP